jgi:hypothetical protein
MKHITKTMLASLLLFCGITLQAQQIIQPDLSKAADTSLWTLQNRHLIKGRDNEVHLSANKGDGMLRLKNFQFFNGKIEMDVKGKNVNGKSFVGLAFHGMNDSTYDVIYFRPFNFLNPTKASHSVQYMSHPTYPWFVLRKQFPGNYESAVKPVPNPDQWFHATFVFDYPYVKVFVNHSEKPCFTVKQLNERKSGWIGLWVGYNSEGYFKNVIILPAP